VSAQIITLADYRDRDLTSRQRVVVGIWERGECECGLCGDLGCLDESTGEGVPCMNCGRTGSP
jgi:hypothetical protein